MLNLTDLKVLILESNNLTNLTVNSLEKNTPQVSYKVITKKEQTNSRIGTALLNTKGITLVVKSGIVLELKEVNAEPLTELANIFDLSVRRKIYDVKTNTQPTLVCEFGKAKAEVFLFMVYPYLLEKKLFVKNILTDLKCPVEYLTNDKQFSYAYLAGYTDAEGCITFELRHQKGWKGIGISSSYRCLYRLTSNNFGHLAYLKNQLEEKGYKFNKDEIKDYKNTKEREGRNPDKWKATKVLIIGGWEQLSNLYKHLLKYSKINNKRQLMKRTQQYHDLIHTTLPRHNAKK